MANKTSRIGAIDFWRGLVLIAILIDHMPGNGLEYATPRNYGFSDSAEGFVFLAGLSIGVIYLPRARKHGLAAVALACVKRALKLYWVHVAITAAALAIFCAAFWLTGLDDLIAVHGRWLVLDDPGLGAAGIALLGHQIGYFNILPLYIALMIWAPIAVALTLIRPWAALIASMGVYVAARAFDLNLPSWPIEGRWFFNPLAWQLMLSSGVFAAARWRDTPLCASKAGVMLSLAIVGGAAAVTTDGFGLAPGLRAMAWAHLDLGKQNLGLVRCAHFFAVAYLVTTVLGGVEARLGSFAEAARALGRHSLPVFAVGSILTALGQAATTIATPKYESGVVLVVAMTYTLFAIVVSFFLARRLDCETPLVPLSALAAPLRVVSRDSSRSWPGSSSAAD